MRSSLVPAAPAPTFPTEQRKPSCLVTMPDAAPFAPLISGADMNYSIALAIVVMTLGLGACDRPAATVVVPAAVPGPPGPQGMTGDQGNRGAAGVTGAQGVSGDTGSKGDTGYTGAQGVSGDQGATGATGQQGRPGDKGKTGSSGGTTVVVVPPSP